MLFTMLFRVGGTHMPNVNELLEIAKAEINYLNLGEVFLVRDLFKGYEWNRISRSDRLLLGTLFLIFMRNENSRAKVIEKTSSGQQKYRISDRQKEDF